MRELETINSVLSIFIWEGERRYYNLSNLLKLKKLTSSLNKLGLNPTDFLQFHVNQYLTL